MTRKTKSFNAWINRIHREVVKARNRQESTSYVGSRTEFKQQ